MSKFYPGLIVVIVIAVGGIGAYFLLNQKVNTENNINLSQTQTPTPTNAIISPTPQSVVATDAATMDNFITTDSGLKMQDIEEGNGKPVISGDTVKVNYIGTLENGTKFDSSYDRNQSFTTQIGTGQVIQGWDEGILGMKAGGKRKLIIPPELGYGSQNVGNIPPNSTLIFEIELLSIN